MSITYTFDVIMVDETARAMEVVYSSTGYQTMHIGMPMPLEGQTLDQIIEMYAPIPYWENSKKPVVPVNPGTTGEITTPPPPPPPTPEELAQRRMKSELEASDWTQLPDVPMSDTLREEWRVYRQALRDVPNQPGYPDNIVWPTPPASVTP